MWVQSGYTLYCFSLKLGIGFKGGGAGIPHFNFMKFMIKCLEGVSPGLSSVFCNK